MSKAMATNSARSSAFTAMAAALAVSLVGAAGILYLQAGAAGGGGSDNARFVAVSQSLPRHAVSAVSGDDGAFTDLAADIDRLGGLQAAGALPGDAASWSGLAEQAGTILDRQPAIDAVWAAERLVSEQMPRLLEG
jgi:hypothetical protein